MSSKLQLKIHFPENTLDEMLDVFEPYIDLIKVKSKVKICRDHKDDFLLALAKDGKAAYFLTGDSEILDIEKFEQTIRLKFKDFIEKINS